MQKITVHSPGTIANLVCGFDVLGLALQEPYDIMELSFKEEPGITITHTDSFALPVTVHENVAGVALQSMIQQYGLQKGLHLTIHKQIKPGSGLGSSAASAAGAVVAANELLGKPFSLRQLTDFAMNGEVLASGARHADNIAPCIYGGVTLVRDSSSIDIIPIDHPPLFITVVHPQIEVKTAYAREILPKEVSLKKAVTQWANIGALIAGLQQHDYDLISRSLQDVIVEPVRSKLIPGFDTIKENCRHTGVMGGGIAGSGPSIFMFSEDRDTALAAEKVMTNYYTAAGIEHKTYVTMTGGGVRIVETQ